MWSFFLLHVFRSIEWSGPVYLYNIYGSAWAAPLVPQQPSTRPPPWRMTQAAATDAEVAYAATQVSADTDADLAYAETQADAQAAPTKGFSIDPLLAAVLQQSQD